MYINKKEEAYNMIKKKYQTFKKLGNIIWKTGLGATILYGAACNVLAYLYNYPIDVDVVKIHLFLLANTGLAGVALKIIGDIGEKYYKK